MFRGEVAETIPQIQAAKDTWALMKDRGIDALINDSLVGSGESNKLSSCPLKKKHDADTAPFSIQSSCGVLT